MRYKKIISIKQLMNIDEGKLVSLLGTHGWTETRPCHAFKNPNNGQVILFNSFGNSHDYNVLNALASLNGAMSNNEMEFISRKYPGAILLTSDKDFWHVYNITSLELYDEDIVKSWDNFVASNKKFIQGLRNSYGSGIESNTRVYTIYAWANGSKNYLEWGIKAHFRNSISMFRIKRALDWCSNYENLVKQLRKSTITAYKSASDIDELFHEMAMLRQNKRANDSIGEFNTMQKKLFRDQDLSKNKELEESLSQFARLSDVKRRNFIRKVSTIENFDELFKNLKWAVSKHFEWDKNSFMEYLHNVEELDYEIKIVENNVVLLSVKDFDTIQKLAKNTNWCISKNKSYWNQYTQGRSNLIQYLLFNFNCKEDDLLSIVGFTVQANKGIIYAHDFSNNNIMSDRNEIRRVPLHSLIPCVPQSSGIYSVLDSCGIDPSSLVRFTSVPYKWTKEEMFNYLFKIVDRKDVEILHDLGNKVAFVIETNHELENFFGRAYGDNLGHLDSYVKHFVFADFGKNQYDADRMHVALITQGSSNEEYCYAMYNLNFNDNSNQFNTFLSDYDLPYDIIRRPANKDIMIWEALESYNIELANKLVDKPSQVIESIKYYCEESYAFLEQIIRSITVYNSIDYLQFFYSKGLSFFNVLGYDYTRALLNSIYQDIHQKLRQNRHLGTALALAVSDKEIQDVLNSKLDNITLDRAIIVKDFIVIKMLIGKEAEQAPCVLEAMCNTLIQDCNTSKPLTLQLLGMCIPYINGDWNNSVVDMIVKSIVFNFSDIKEIKEPFANLIRKHSFIEALCKKYEILKSESSHKSFFAPPQGISSIVTTISTNDIARGIHDGEHDGLIGEWDNMFDEEMEDRAYAPIGR